MRRPDYWFADYPGALTPEQVAAHDVVQQHHKAGHRLSALKHDGTSAPATWCVPVSCACRLQELWPGEVQCSASRSVRSSFTTQVTPVRPPRRPVNVGLPHKVAGIQVEPGKEHEPRLLTEPQSGGEARVNHLSPVLKSMETASHITNGLLAGLLAKDIEVPPATYFATIQYEGVQVEEAAFAHVVRERGIVPTKAEVRMSRCVLASLPHRLGALAHLVAGKKGEGRSRSQGLTLYSCPPCPLLLCVMQPYPPGLEDLILDTCQDLTGVPLAIIAAERTVVRLDKATGKPVINHKTGQPQQDVEFTPLLIKLDVSSAQPATPCHALFHVARTHEAHLYGPQSNLLCCAQAPSHHALVPPPPSTAAPQLNCPQLKSAITKHHSVITTFRYALAWAAKRTAADSGDMPFVTTGLAIKAFDLNNTTPA